MSELHANLMEKTLMLMEAHRLFRHVNVKAVQHAITSGKVTGIKLDETTQPEFCKACMQAKLHCKPFPKKTKNHMKKFGKQIHSDLWGPAMVESICHNKYSIDFIDCAT